jgi:UDP-N-acetyl-D-glucosamine dehydrogenase
MYDLQMESVPLTAENLKRYDCTVIATDHSCYDYEFIINNAPLVVDTRNAIGGVGKKDNVIKA